MQHSLSKGGKHLVVYVPVPFWFDFDPDFDNCLDCFSEYSTWYRLISATQGRPINNYPILTIIHLMENGAFSRMELAKKLHFRIKYFDRITGSIWSKSWPCNKYCGAYFKIFLFIRVIRMIRGFFFSLWNVINTSNCIITTKDTKTGTNRNFLRFVE